MIELVSVAHPATGALLGAILLKRIRQTPVLVEQVLGEGIDCLIAMLDGQLRDHIRPAASLPANLRGQSSAGAFTPLACERYSAKVLHRAMIDR